MDRLESNAADERLDELAHEFSEQLRRGERPTIEAFAKASPQLAAEIYELFPTLLLVEQATPMSSRSGSIGFEASPSRVGEYRILRRIGRGGMGTVYEAIQEPLDRRVALKLITSRDQTNPQVLERFKREARAASQLHHTNIVPMFNIGECAGFYFYTMQLIEGQSLDLILAELESPEQAAHASASPGRMILSSTRADYYQQVARVGLQAAEALAYAHEKGVLHRDIKPGNLMLDDHGKVWVTDFGLAQIDGVSDLTQSQDVLGTLSHIPPERFRGCTDARGDIYSLGLTLYEILTRRKAFQTKTRVELVHRILHTSPPSPRSVNGRIPRDLETVVLKAIDREPARRYQTATDMAEDLRRFCADRPVLARRLSITELWGRWCWRNPLPAISCAVAVLLLLALSTISTIAYFREDYLLDMAQTALQRAEVAEVAARNELFASHLASAKASRLSRQQGQRIDSLAAIHKAVKLLPFMNLSADEQTQHRVELRDLAITCLALPDIRELEDCAASAMTPDIFRLNRCAQHDGDGMLRICEWRDGAELARLPNVDQDTEIFFTPEPDVMLLLNKKARTLHRWRIAEAESTLVAKLAEHDGVCVSAMFSSNSRRLMLLHRIEKRGMVEKHGVVEILEWPSGKLCYCRGTHFGEGAYPARLSPDGNQLAVIEGAYGREGANIVTVTNVNSLQEIARLKNVASVNSVAWHPDSETLTVGQTDSNDIVLWNVKQQKQVGLLKNQRGGGPVLAMNATGELLASKSTWSNTLNIWHPYSRKVLMQMTSPLLFEWQSQYGGLVGEANRAGGGWHYATVEPSPVLLTLARNPIHGDVEAWRGASVHPANRLLAVGSGSGVSFFDLQTGQDVGFLPIGYALNPWFIPETGDLLTYSEQGLMRWPVSISEQHNSQVTIGPPQRLPCPAVMGTTVTSDRSGKVIAAAAKKKAYILHDFGEHIVTLEPLADCRHAAVSPDGRWVVTTNHESGPTIAWDASTGAHLHCFNEDRATGYVVFSPNGEEVSLVGSSPHRWQTTTWSTLALPSAAQDIGFACYSADGQLAIELSSAGATLVEVRTGQKLAILQLPDTPTYRHAILTPDGLRVILNSNDQHSTYVWNLPDLAGELSGIGLDIEHSIPQLEVSYPKFAPTLELTIKTSDTGP
jgi:serine/threonine protein kinase/WD40 repeat protein